MNVKQISHHEFKFTEKLQYLKTLRRNLPMYKNYTYKYESDKRYLCCSRYRSLKCNARLVVDAEGNIVRAKGNHNHPPPVYYTCKNGVYYEQRNFTTV